MSHLQTMTRQDRRAAERYLQRENAKHPECLSEVSREAWPEGQPANLMRVWRSRGFLVQLYIDKGWRRLSVNRAELGKGGRWSDEISWDELQRLKREAGFGDCDAVEVFPRDSDVVNVANMRHLWLMPGPLPFAWRRS